MLALDESFGPILPTNNFEFFKFLFIWKFSHFFLKFSRNFSESYRNWGLFDFWHSFEHIEIRLQISHVLLQIDRLKISMLENNSKKWKILFHESAWPPGTAAPSAVLIERAVAKLEVRLSFAHSVAFPLARFSPGSERQKLDFSNGLSKCYIYLNPYSAWS